MNDISTLVTASSLLITALGTAVATVITALRSSKRERSGSAERVVKQLLAAAEDGEITPEEMAKIASTLTPGTGKGKGKAAEE